MTRVAVSVHFPNRLIGISINIWRLEITDFQFPVKVLKFWFNSCTQTKTMVTWCDYSLIFLKLSSCCRHATTFNVDHKNSIGKKRLLKKNVFTCYWMAWWSIHLASWWEHFKNNIYLLSHTSNMLNYSMQNIMEIHVHKSLKNKWIYTKRSRSDLSWIHSIGET